jgi:hypothetical protein
MIAGSVAVPLWNIVDGGSLASSISAISPKLGLPRSSPLFKIPPSDAMRRAGSSLNGKSVLRETVFFGLNSSTNNLGNRRESGKTGSLR